jgi:hypothetical protein
MAVAAERTLGDFYWPALLKSGLSPDAPPGGRGEDHLTWSRLLKGDRALPEGRILPDHQIQGRRDERAPSGRMEVLQTRSQERARCSRPRGTHRARYAL